MATLALDDGTLAYDVTGTGPPLVCIHGGWLNSETWQAQVDRFAEDYRIVTFDIRGHGRTGPTEPQSYSVELFADDLECLLDHLAIDRPVLCGLSLGAMVAQVYLERFPGRAAGAVLAGPVRSMPPVALPTGMKALFSPLPALTASLTATGPQATFRSLLASIRAVTGGPWLSVDGSVRSRAVDAVGDMPRSEFRKTFDALYAFEPPALSRVQTPTLVVYGDHEAAQVKRQGRYVASAVDDGRVHSIPDAGHLVNQDQPGAFNATVGEFLAGLDAA